MAAWRQRGGTGGSLAVAAAMEVLRCQLGAVVATASAAWLQRLRNDGGNGGGATAATQRRWWRQLGCGSLAAAQWRQQLVGGGGIMVAAARWRWRKWQQRAAMVEATVTGWWRQLSSDARTFECHRHANVRPLSLVKDRGTTVLIASSSATAAPVVTSTMAAAAQTKPKAMLMIPFVKLNTLLN